MAILCRHSPATASRWQGATACRCGRCGPAALLWVRREARLTLRHGLPIKPALSALYASVRMQRETAGECPERQRGRTVNPLAYAFVGSSPTSPTSLRAFGASAGEPRAEACPPKPLDRRSPASGEAVGEGGPSIFRME